jgi:hypothetical protein
MIIIIIIIIIKITPTVASAAQSSRSKTRNHASQYTIKSPTSCGVIEPPAEAALGQSVDKSSVSSCSTLGDSLKPNIQNKQLLAIDCEAVGILHVGTGLGLTIYQICKRRMKIYGKRSDPIRKQIQQKVHHSRRKVLKTPTNCMSSSHFGGFSALLKEKS